MKVKLFIIVLLLSVFSLGYYSDDNNPSSNVYAKPDNFYTKIKVFTSILETISRVYVDETQKSELIDDAIKGILDKLDPHTVYLPADDYSNWNQTFDGYSGIGISFDKIGGEFTIMSVIKGSPAAQSGLKTGDKILKVNNFSLAGLNNDETIHYLSGPIGAPVALSIIRDEWQHPKDIKITRRKIVLKSVTPYMMIKSHTGYVKIDRFTSTTSRELEHALNELESSGMSYLILDLRGNSGGYLNAAIDVADKFIPGGFKIVTTKGRVASSFQEYYATDIHTHPLYPMAVLIDHGSASAAEIVAGAIQDLDRGLIIGKSSFGKGLVQSQYRFLDGSALLITTARYYTPSGRPIQRNFIDKTKEEYYEDAYNDQAIKHRIHLHDTVYKTLSGRPVYDHGGITPDIWIENEQNILSDNLRSLLFSKNKIFYVFAEKYIKKYPKLKSNPNRFISDFHVTDHIFRQFCTLALQSKPDLTFKTLIKDKPNIKFLIKREMAYIIGGNKARFKVNLSRDYQLQAGIKYLSKANALLTVADLPD